MAQKEDCPPPLEKENPAREPDLEPTSSQEQNISEPQSQKVAVVDMKEPDPDPDPKAEPETGRARSKTRNKGSRPKSKSRATLSAAELCRVGEMETKSMAPELEKLYKKGVISGKDIEDPANFPGAPRLVTIIRMPNESNKKLWRRLESASEVSVEGSKMADWGHPSLKNSNARCSGRVTSYVHPSLYRSLKLMFPEDIGDFVAGDRVSTQQGTGDLRPLIGVLGPECFRPVVDTERNGKGSE